MSGVDVALLWDHQRADMMPAVKHTLRIAEAVFVAVCALAVAGCSSGTSGGTDSGSGGGGGGGGGKGSGGGNGIALSVTVNFSGPDPLQGTFTDKETGYASCGEYASTNTALGWIGPAPSGQGGTADQIGGKTVSWFLAIDKASFHGPGTYTPRFNALAIDKDDYSNLTGTTLTLNADGSGNLSFSGGSSFNGPSGNESGTMTWTCAAA